MNPVIEQMLKKYEPKNQQELERALREILQELTLVGLWRGKFFEHAAFYGGTALRILYGLDRFSEDLDFTLLDKSGLFEWDAFEHSVVQELQSYGFSVTFKEKEKKMTSAVRSAFLKTNTRQGLLQMTTRTNVKGHPDAILRIKVEIDTDPSSGYTIESIYLHDPLPVPIKAVTQPNLFAGKVHAALFRAWKHRVKGRDWYDVVWFLRRDTPLNPQYLQACMKREQPLALEEVKSLLMSKLETIDMESAKQDVQPFLRDPSQLDVWSIDFFHYWFKKLRFPTS